MTESAPGDANSAKPPAFEVVGHDGFASDHFVFPERLVLSCNRQRLAHDGLDFDGLSIEAGELLTHSGEKAEELYGRARLSGFTLFNSDEEGFVLYAMMEGRLRSVGLIIARRLMV